ncbi:trigger factor-like isoform X3 [Zingiber officinale]|uniref:trigger factor-like isoform X3 n=1 Tax=Zingiber officinale TaxID=94328 RepID=UPI001C4C6C7F|nr:trigger factor-like isoform X3 [Zingiber officinale]
MESAVQTLFIGHNPQAILQKQRKFFCSRLLTSPRTRICASVSLKRVSSENFRRIGCRIPNAILAISSDLGNIGESLATFEDFTVTTTNMGDREIKIRVDASGARTQANFDNAFSKLVAAAQPIPGFRRVKGGKTPDIPKDVLLHIIGPSKVYKQSIKKLINTTVAEFVEKKSLKVTKDLRVEQSFEELESKFQPGDDFGFDATLQFQVAIECHHQVTAISTISNLKLYDAGTAD